ncbi:hypothetical protein CSC3H3_02630 [Thalassospira marina]|uniref:Uncharacterized protein n=1 Tax=Thalassospira marina TaxID=2048283 RepID=A0ABM6Q5E4_9PROT|nr:hypothetical protein CSC3H3_02630 [Thalassospira marina]
MNFPVIIVGGREPAFFPGLFTLPVSCRCLADPLSAVLAVVVILRKNFGSRCLTRRNLCEKTIFPENTQKFQNSQQSEMEILS